MRKLDEYLFDSCGFLRHDNFIDGNEVQRLSELLEPHWQPTRSEGVRRIRNLMGVSPELVELAERIPHDLQLHRYLNQAYRLIESYALHRVGGSRQDLHNGFSQEQLTPWGSTSTRTLWRHHTYHDGRTYCMMIKVIVYLTDVMTTADGPFCWLEGSHKSNFALPMSKDEISKAMTTNGLPSLRTVGVNAGDAIILNEALTHGSMPKSTSKSRILMAFSYAPMFVSDYREVEGEINSVLTPPAFYIKESGS